MPGNKRVNKIDDRNMEASTTINGNDPRHQSGKSSSSLLEGAGVQRVPLHSSATTAGSPIAASQIDQTIMREMINQLLAGGQHSVPQVDLDANALLSSLIEAQRQAAIPQILQVPQIPQLGAAASLNPVLLSQQSEHALSSSLQTAYLQNYLSNMGQSTLMNSIFEQILMGQLGNTMPSYYPSAIPGAAGPTSNSPFTTFGAMTTDPSLQGLIMAQNPQQVLHTVSAGSASQERPRKRQRLGSDSPPSRVLALPEDHEILSEHQIFLRSQIEAFCATSDDISTHTRGRNKPVSLGQVGIRCRHCAHVPVKQRQKGSTYFPASLLGLYQAAQNMCSTHMQSGLCDQMPHEVRHQFAQLLTSKVSGSGAGRPYWARAATKLGLVDTEDGIRLSSHDHLNRSNGS
ncbi:unnamed protein product [Cylindrotheca closterium]|uniref:Uncharacterized protein n=1 Tax=Cylindrotheca closterium TaxID=2856 RepID=A0AAD2FZS2_9STRA|nr:unnamed protein product [Cylindrotheca closterium]